MTIADRISHAFLPVLTLSLTGISSIALHTRAKMADIMESPYVSMPGPEERARCRSW